MKSEVIGIRIEADLLDYVRQLAQAESRSIAKQLAHIIKTHKTKAEQVKKLYQQYNGKK